MKQEISLSELHDIIYEITDNLIQRYDPCKIDENGRCEESRPNENTCCKGCKHLGAGGCTVDALYCKLYLCWKAAKENPELAAKLTPLWTLSHRIFGISGRKSKQETLDGAPFSR